MVFCMEFGKGRYNSALVRPLWVRLYGILSDRVMSVRIESGLKVDPFTSLVTFIVSNVKNWYEEVQKLTNCLHYIIDIECMLNLLRSLEFKML